MVGSNAAQSCGEHLGDSTNIVEAPGCICRVIEATIGGYSFSMPSYFFEFASPA
jgi:hypothetical protein